MSDVYLSLKATFFETHMEKYTHVPMRLGEFLEYVHMSRLSGKGALPTPGSSLISLGNLQR